MQRFPLGGRQLFTILRFSGLVFFPVLLLVGVDLSKTADVLRDSQLALVVVAVLLMQAAILLRVLRWKLVAEASGVHYPRFWDYLVLFYTGLFAGTAMPQIAASFAPVLFVSETGHSWRRAALSIMFDRLAELLVILLFAFAAAIYLYPDFPELSLAVVSALVALAVGGLIAVPVLPHARRWLNEGGARFAPVKNLLQLGQSDDAREMLTKLRGRLVPAVLITAAILIIQTGIIVILAEALSLDVSLPFLIMAWSLVTLAVTLPISIGGLGLREGVLVVMFTTVGEPKEEALALGILFFVVVMITRLPGALTWLRGASALSTSPAVALAERPADGAS